MRMTAVIGIVGAALALGLVVAATQDSGKAQPAPPKLDPKACADSERLTQGDTHEAPGKETSGSNLSDKLARSDGVICPPTHLDPEIRAPAPGGGRTPVIPPPTERDPDTQAK